jgi:uncharacterized protein (TIGR02328 family)
MRLWHYLLIPHLPDKLTTQNRKLNQLGGQNSECCGARGLGWGRNHKIVNYIWNYNYMMLYRYHQLIMIEMISRGMLIHNENWFDPLYRGQKIGYVNGIRYLPNYGKPILEHYPEHNDAYLNECLENLKGKGIIINEDVNRLEKFKIKREKK